MKKQIRRFPYLLVGGVTIVAGIGIYFVASAWDRPQRVGETPSDILRRSGYLEIRPATDVGGPGTLITIDVKTNDYVMLHPTCNMDWQEVAGLWQTSPTSDTEIAHQLEGEFKLGAEALRSAGFDLSAMVQVSSKDKKCVTQPISAMQADVAYRVEFSDGVAASEKAKVLGGVSGTLTGSGAATGNDSVVGKNLFVGLKLNGWCIVPNDGQAGASVASLPTAVSVPTR